MARLGFLTEVYENMKLIMPFETEKDGNLTMLMAILRS